MHQDICVIWWHYLSSAALHNLLIAAWWVTIENPFRCFGNMFRTFLHLISEATIHTCVLQNSIYEKLLKIHRKAQALESLCSRIVSLNLQLFYKKGSILSMSLRILRNFLEKCFKRNSPDKCFYL